MNPTSLDIQEIIVAEKSLGATLGVNLFLSTMPAKPYDCILLLDQASNSPQDSRLNIDTDNLQISIRNRTYNEGYEKARKIKELLQSKPPLELNGIKYIGFWLVSNIFPQYLDENRCYLFTLYFKIKREDTEGYRQ